MITEDTVCHNHSNRPAAVGCQRCSEPICASCMKSASVGFHCPSCASDGAQKVHRGVPSASNGGLSVTNVMLAAIAAVYVWQIVAPSSTDEILLLGPAVADNEIWRVITSGFAHGSVMHIAFNGYAIWVLGKALEDPLGKLQYLLVYLGGLFGGSFAVLLFDWDVRTLGASGAVLGVVGGLAIAYRSRGLSVFGSSLGFMILLNLGLPLLLPGRISFWGHLGGFVGGVVVAALLLSGGQVGQKISNAKTLLAGSLVAVLAVGAVAVGYLGPLVTL